MEADNQWVRPDMKVFAPEGNELGVVKDVRGDVFQVDVAHAPDYWLRVDDAVRRDLEEVVMRFPHDELGQHTVPAPEILLS